MRTLRRRLNAAIRRLLRPFFRRLVDEIIRELGTRVVDGQPNLSLFNWRFHDAELTTRNVNQVVAHISRQLYPGLADTPAPEPSRTPLLSKMCVQRDFESDWLAVWSRQINEQVRFHRKLWEFCYIAQALHAADMLRGGRTGLGFGCGTEPLPSLFAKLGARVLATDLAAREAAAGPWQAINSHADSRDAVLRADICPPDRLGNIEFRAMDMNDIPDDLAGGFDFCWSACSLEHLGSRERGLAFIERSLTMLKPGGVAVHTTEFSLDPAATFDNFDTVLYRPEHFSALAERVRRCDAELATLDFDPGDGVLDKLPALAALFPDVVSDPTLVNVKVSLGGFMCTSFGLIVRKNG
jgi:SAM-dependent methyltransferase